MFGNRRPEKLFKNCIYRTDIVGFVAPLVLGKPYKLQEIKTYDKAKTDQDIRVDRIAEVLCPNIGASDVYVENSTGEEAARKLAIKVGKKACQKCPLIESDYGGASLRW